MKSKLGAAMVAFLLLFVSAAYAGSTVTPDTPQTVGGSAAIAEGVGETPTVEYVWVLPDDVPAVEGTQLEIIASGERNDIYACLVVGDLDSRDSITDVFVDLYHPDESFKYQVHAMHLDHLSSGLAEIEECLDLGVAAGLLTEQDRLDIEYNIMSQPNWYMYKVYLPMYYHQPSGMYSALGYAVDDTSRISVPTEEEFEWVPGTYLELDFDTVVFGNIQPGQWKILNGDLDMGTPDMPTLKNEGNTEVLVGVEFSEWVGQGALPNKKIVEFDAQLRNMLASTNYREIPGEHLEMLAEQEVWFQYPISLCRQEKIDFSIHADIGTVPDEYQGSVTVLAQPVIVSSPEPNSIFPVQVV